MSRHDGAKGRLDRLGAIDEHMAEILERLGTGRTVRPDRLYHLTSDGGWAPPGTAAHKVMQLRQVIGPGVIESVWPTRINDRGERVRDMSPGLGIRGYRMRKG